jgi:5'-methylthioadenosine phosphorylase
VSTIGVIGGSGLYELPGLRAIEQVRVDTPFGEPSDTLVRGRLGSASVVFLPRHGRGHRLLPSEINFRANVFALKSLGVEWLISVGAVGSLRQELAPGHVVVPDQFIDRTVRRASTFFGDGIVAHVAFADPVCRILADHVAAAVGGAGGRAHRGGTYVCMEGPQFSTRAESELYRSWKAHVIGMTNLQEAKLAREAEMCFASLALVTDYDCWNTEAGDVEIGDVLRILGENVELARRTIAGVVAALPVSRNCPCPRALEHAIITDRERIPANVKSKLAPLIGKYVGSPS